jgi:hypothetical protein
MGHTLRPPLVSFLLYFHTKHHWVHIGISPIATVGRNILQAWSATDQSSIDSGAPTCKSPQNGLFEDETLPLFYSFVSVLVTTLTRSAPTWSSGICREETVSSATIIHLSLLDQSNLQGWDKHLCGICSPGNKVIYRMPQHVKRWTTMSRVL